MTHEQILAAQHQAGWHPAGHGFAVQHGNGDAQIVPAAKLYALPNESKLSPSSGLTTLLSGCSAYLRIEISSALILDGQATRSGGALPSWSLFVQPGACGFTLPVD